ncbi:MAG: beta strand repeat-containing protein, partial [bacterium]
MSGKKFSLIPSQVVRRYFGGENSGSPSRRRKIFRLALLDLLEERQLLATYVVNTTTDDVQTTGSLRWAIAQANTNVADPVNFISFATSLNGQTITLSSGAGPLLVNNSGGKSLEIIGPGQTNLAISGAGSTGIFQISTPAGITNLTLTDGNGGGLPAGGAIYSNSSLRLENMLVANTTSSVAQPFSLYQVGGFANLNSTTLGNAIEVSGMGNLIVNGGQLFNPLSISNGNSISVVNYGQGLQLGAITASRLELQSTSGSITQLGNTDITVTGSAKFISSGTGSSGNILLNMPTNKFSPTASIVSCGTNVSIYNSNTIILGNTSASGDLNVRTPVGNIIQEIGKTIKVTGFASFVSPGNSISLNSNTNEFATLAANGSLVSVNVANSVNLGAIIATGGLTINGDVTKSSLSVTGPIDASAGSGVVSLTGRNITVAGNIVTGSGDIVLFGNGGGLYQPGTFDGVSITGPRVNLVSSGGNIFIDGRAAAGSNASGINLSQAQIQTCGTGSINLTGVSSNGSGGFVFGVVATGATISAVDGSVLVSGTSYGNGTDSRGVKFDSGTNINTTGTGNLSINGYAACGTASAYGVWLLNSSVVSTNNGSLAISGTSFGTGTSSYGMVLELSANL